jgi:HPt (histidine-containing phosphotransfer) domain-containing protein
MTDLPVLDRATLDRLRRLGGDALARQMVALFREAAPQRVAAARAGLEAGDLAAVARAAHALVSNAGNVGGMEVVGCARALDEAGSARRSAEVAELVARLDSAYERLVAALAEAEEEVSA